MCGSDCVSCSWFLQEMTLRSCGWSLLSNPGGFCRLLRCLISSSNCFIVLFFIFDEISSPRAHALNATRVEGFLHDRTASAALLFRAQARSSAAGILDKGVEFL